MYTYNREKVLRNIAFLYYLQVTNIFYFIPFYFILFYSLCLFCSILFHFKISFGGFLGGSVDKNLPANAVIMGSIPDPERSHMCWNHWSLSAWKPVLHQRSQHTEKPEHHNRGKPRAARNTQHSQEYQERKITFNVIFDSQSWFHNLLVDLNESFEKYCPSLWCSKGWKPERFSLWTRLRNFANLFQIISILIFHSFTYSLISLVRGIAMESLPWVGHLSPLLGKQWWAG